MAIDNSVPGVEIRSITQEDYEKAHALQCEYLDKESLDSFLERVHTNPDLYLVAVHENHVIGVCYGHPSKRDAQSMTLQGIAVNLDETKGYARRGIGSKMLASFEAAVKKRGLCKIGVGSADDQKVECFYLKNGFYPVELVAKDLHGEELERTAIQSYEAGQLRREALRKKYNPQEVIFIFEKALKDTPERGMSLRVLTGEDGIAYRTLRLQALKQSPEAFLTTYEEYVHRSVDEVAKRLVPTDYSFTVGAFDEAHNELVGTVTLVREQRPKTAHIAEVVGMFVAPEFRRQGVGRMLLQELMKRARAWSNLVQLQLTVVKGNDAATQLYELIGFRTYATAPRAVYSNGRFVDELLMVLSLD